MWTRSSAYHFNQSVIKTVFTRRLRFKYTETDTHPPYHNPLLSNFDLSIEHQNENMAGVLRLGSAPFLGVYNIYENEFCGPSRRELANFVKK